MKFFSIILTTFSVMVAVLAAGVKSPTKNHRAYPLGSIDFKFDPTNQATLKTDSVTVGLQKLPVGATPNLISLGVLKKDSSFSAKLQLPPTVPKGKYNLIAVENLVGDVSGGETFHMFNQSLIIL